MLRNSGQHGVVSGANDGRRLRLVRQQRIKGRKQRQLRYLQWGFGHLRFAFLHPRVNGLRRKRKREVTNDGTKRMLVPVVDAKGRTTMRFLQ
ncbi:hypothetical protein D3C72_1681840 [compost metagenome]